jgi:hypothetical protein
MQAFPAAPSSAMRVGVIRLAEREAMGDDALGVQLPPHQVLQQAPSARPSIHRRGAQDQS